jgi:hypothetical protein
MVDPKQNAIYLEYVRPAQMAVIMAIENNPNSIFGNYEVGQAAHVTFCLEHLDEPMRDYITDAYVQAIEYGLMPTMMDTDKYKFTYTLSQDSDGRTRHTYEHIVTEADKL